MTFFSTYITSDKDKENLKLYKYNGIDGGLSYNYIFAPLCEKTLPFLPSYLAYIYIKIVQI